MYLEYVVLIVMSKQSAQTKIVFHLLPSFERLFILLLEFCDKLIAIRSLLVIRHCNNLHSVSGCDCPYLSLVEASKI